MKRSNYYSTYDKNACGWGCGRRLAVVCLRAPCGPDEVDLFPKLQSKPPSVVFDPRGKFQAENEIFFASPPKRAWGITGPAGRCPRERGLVSAGLRSNIGAVLSLPNLTAASSSKMRLKSLETEDLFTPATSLWGCSIVFVYDYFNVL